MPVKAVAAEPQKGSKQKLPTPKVKTELKEALDAFRGLQKECLE